MVLCSSLFFFFLMLCQWTQLPQTNMSVRSMQGASTNSHQACLLSLCCMPFSSTAMPTLSYIAFLTYERSTRVTGMRSDAVWPCKTVASFRNKSSALSLSWFSPKSGNHPLAKEDDPDSHGTLLILNPELPLKQHTSVCCLLQVLRGDLKNIPGSLKCCINFF